MRCNQVSILIERFGKYVPNGYHNDTQRISVYCDDSTSIYAALAKANAMVINELNETESIGVSSYVSTNEYSKADYVQMHGRDPIVRHAYEDDLELQFTYKNNELRQDRIWAHENIDEIIQFICAVEDKKLLKNELKDKFALKEFQIKKLLSMRLDMFSKDDYLRDIEEQKEFEERSAEKMGCSPVKEIKWYRRWIRDAKNKLDEYNTYIIMAENYKEIIGIISNNPKFEDYASILKDKYGFDYRQVKLIKSITIDDLTSAGAYREEAKKAEEEIERLEKDLEECISKMSDK